MATEQQFYKGTIQQTEYFTYPWVLVNQRKYYMKIYKQNKSHPKWHKILKLSFYTTKNKDTKVY